MMPKRPTHIDDAVFNFRIVGQCSVFAGVYGALMSCGLSVVRTPGPSHAETFATIVLCGVVWLVLVNHWLVRHFERARREGHRCTKERLDIGFANFAFLVYLSATLAGIVTHGQPRALSVPGYLIGAVPGVYAAWQGARWWREANRMDRVKRNQCITCGYDLRASPDRCPECGTAHTGASR